MCPGAVDRIATLYRENARFREAAGTYLEEFETMLARAREPTSDPAIRYRLADLDAVDLPSAAFDLAHSALTLHYLTDLGRLFATVHRALVPGGDEPACDRHRVRGRGHGRPLSTFQGSGIRGQVSGVRYHAGA